NPRQAVYLRFLGRAHLTRAGALLQLGRDEEAAGAGLELDRLGGPGAAPNAGAGDLLTRGRGPARRAAVAAAARGAAGAQGDWEGGGGVWGGGTRSRGPGRAAARPGGGEGRGSPPGVQRTGLVPGDLPGAALPRPAAGGRAGTAGGRAGPRQWRLPDYPGRG